MLKEATLSNPVLKGPVPNRRFYHLKTDWSANTQGSVLCCKQGVKKKKKVH